MKTEVLHQKLIASKGVATDTRQLRPGTLFFAIKGAHFNGNDYALQALEKGSTWAVVDDQTYRDHPQCIVVDDTVKSLQQLAHYHRQQFQIPLIGITGSNGKTTTKELMGAVLSQSFKLLITEGNLNNHLGVPLTLLQLNHLHELAIVEMGASQPGDIQTLAEIAAPTHGIITNMGEAHLEKLGSIQGVISTKTALYRFLEKSGGTVFYNADDATIVRHLPKSTTAIAYGTRTGDIQGTAVPSDAFVHFKWTASDYRSPLVETQMTGGYNLPNFLCAAAVGHHFGVPNEKITAALADYAPSNKRSQMQRTKRNTLVVDCYNANPTSMKAAIESFAQLKSDQKKLMILGDLLELGAASHRAHQEIADFAASSHIATFLVGTSFGKVHTSFPQWEHAAHFINEKIGETIADHIVLLKGSRGVQLEQLIRYL